MIKTRTKEGSTVFTCSGCSTEIRLSLYAVAQIAMGNDMLHTCACGARHGIRREPGSNEYLVAQESSNQAQAKLQEGGA